MAIPTVYRWDDANAPQITNIHDWTQIKDWFQAIFVNGYLEDDNVTQKPALGWSVTVDDATNKITLDMIGDANTENLMRVISNFSKQVNNNYYGASVDVFSHLNLDILSTTNSNTNYAHFSWLGQNDDNLKICPWVVIGTSRGVYVLAGHNNLISPPNKSKFNTQPNYSNFKYFGNFINDGVDLGRNNQIVGLGRETTGLTTVTSIYSTSAYHFTKNNPPLINRNFKNEYSHNKQCVCNEMLDSSAYIYLSSPELGLRYPYIDGGLYIKPYKIHILPELVYIGRQAGLYYSVHKKPLTNSDNMLIEFEGSGIYAGDKFIGLGSTLHGEFYINTSEDWGI